MAGWAGSPTGAEGVLQDSGSGHLALLLHLGCLLQQCKYKMFDWDAEHDSKELGRELEECYVEQVTKAANSLCFLLPTTCMMI